MPKLLRVSQHRDLQHFPGNDLKPQLGQEFTDSLEAIQEGIAEGKLQVFDVASREGCRMAKRSMLRLFESNGRGRSGLAVALPGQLHSQSGSLLPWTTQQPPSTGILVRGAGETNWWTSTRSVRPSSRVR